MVNAIFAAFGRAALAALALALRKGGRAIAADVTTPTIRKLRLVNGIMSFVSKISVPSGRLYNLCTVRSTLERLSLISKRVFIGAGNRRA